MVKVLQTGSEHVTDLKLPYTSIILQCMPDIRKLTCVLAEKKETVIIVAENHTIQCVVIPVW